MANQSQDKLRDLLLVDDHRFRDLRRVVLMAEKANSYEMVKEDVENFQAELKTVMDRMGNRALFLKRSIQEELKRHCSNEIKKHAEVLTCVNREIIRDNLLFSRDIIEPLSEADFFSGPIQRHQ